MDDKDQKVDSIIPKAHPSHVSEPCWVYCDSYRCLAVMDKKGKWRSYATGEELTDFVKVCVT
jgi:hypothetical protein